MAVLVALTQSKQFSVDWLLALFVVVGVVGGGGGRGPARTEDPSQPSKPAEAV